MIEQKLNVEQTQKIIITQELRQAIALLTMPLLELQHFVEEQLQTNPVLEQEYETTETNSEEEGDLAEHEPDQIQGLLNNDLPDTESNYEWEKIADEWEDPPFHSDPFREQREYQYEPVALDYANLYEYLMFQLNIMHLDEAQRRIAEFIVSNLGRDGYLLMLPEDMATALHVSLGELYEMLHIVRSLDPPGIGGVNLKQCLFLQLDPVSPHYGALTDIVYNYLDMVASNRLPLIAKKMKLPVSEVQKLVDIIRSLNPRPGLAVESDATVEYIYPDMVIERVDNDFVILVNDCAIPKVGINSYYLRLIRDDSNMSDDVKSFIKQKLDSAAWIIKGIEQRRSTIYHIAEAIIELQHDFFEYGPSHLMPLNLNTVACMVGVHESTVSRAISNKYVQTPHGLFPWKYFFVNGVGGEGQHKSAATNVKSFMKDLIDKEDNEHPLNDEELMECLSEYGIFVSRRTVAKYRKDLGIPSAGKRRRY